MSASLASRALEALMERFQYHEQFRVRRCHGLYQVTGDCFGRTDVVLDRLTQREAEELRNRMIVYTCKEPT